jgi:type VI secretion system secreted protein Hcp
VGSEREVTRVPRSVRRFYLPLIAVCVLVVGIALANVGESSQPSKPHASASKPPTLNAMLTAAATAPSLSLKYDTVTTTGINAVLNSFQWGVGRSITGSGASAPSVEEITVTKTFDDYSGPFVNASLRGAPTKAVIFFNDSAGAQFLQFSLEGVQISGYSTSSGGEKPSESLSLHFTKITMRAVRAGKPDYVVTYDTTAPTP